jgi:hypothetical protein
VARTRLLDYFTARRRATQDDHVLFGFEKSMALGSNEQAFLTQLCLQVFAKRGRAGLHVWVRFHLLAHASTLGVLRNHSCPTFGLLSSFFKKYAFVYFINCIFKCIFFSDGV